MQNSTKPTTRETIFFAINTEASYLYTHQTTPRIIRNGKLVPMISIGPKIIDVSFLSLTWPFASNLFRTKPNGERRKHMQAKAIMDFSVPVFKSKYPSFCIKTISSISIPSKMFSAANIDNNKTGFR